MALAAIVLVAGAIGCDEGGDGRYSNDSTPSISDRPLKQDGKPSDEFEPEDIERAENASEAVKDYCADAVSEAQRVGCESHVDESDIP